MLSQVSILIVTWNGDDVLRDCLQSLARVYGVVPEIVVVDNAQQGSTRELVGQYSNAKYVSSPKNLGFAGGNNLGLPFCTRKYIVLLNNDTVTCGDSISPLVRFLDDHTQCGAAQGTTVIAAHPDRTDATGHFWSPIGILATQGYDQPLLDAPSQPARVFAVNGAFFIVRREAIVAAGCLFYDHYKSYYEEINFCHRLWLVGYECWYVPTVPVHHRRWVTTARVGREKVVEQYYRNIWHSTLTCFGPLGLMRFVPCLALLCAGQAIVGLLRFNPFYCVAHMRNTGRLIRDFGNLVRTRRAVRSAARLSDWSLFKRAVRSQPWGYYLHMLRGG